MKFFTNKIVNNLNLRQPIFLVFDKKSPKSEKIQSWKKVIFDAKNQKYRPPDLYRRILQLKFQEKWHFFLKKKISDTCIFFWTDNFIGTV